MLEEMMSDFVRIPVGRGTPEGVNSAYVVPDSGVVIDPGPPTDSSWSALRDGIERTEISVQGIDHVLVTHWHADHAGLACRLADRANASIHLHEGDAHLVGDYTEARQRRLRRDASILGRWGVPERIREALLDRDAPSPLPDTYPVQAHEEGDRIAGIEVVHTPGHTKGHVSFATAETLFLGDVLLPTYTPNVGGSDTRLDDPLATYLSSLERVETIAAGRTGEPGHGTTMDVDAAIKAVREHHHQRAKDAYDVVATTNEPTAWTVARELFGEMNGIHAKFGAGEAAAHLDRLAALGVVERIEADPVRYRTAVADYPSSVNLTP